MDPKEMERVTKIHLSYLTSRQEYNKNSPSYGKLLSNEELKKKAHQMAVEDLRNPNRFANWS